MASRRVFSVWRTTTWGKAIFGAKFRAKCKMLNGDGTSMETIRPAWLFANPVYAGIMTREDSVTEIHENPDAPCHPMEQITHFK
jgi:hypothetical protein